MSDEYEACRVGSCVVHEKHCRDCFAPIGHFHGKSVDRCRACWKVWKTKEPLVAGIAGAVGALWRSVWLSEPLGVPGLPGEGLHALELRKRFPCGGCEGRGRVRAFRRLWKLEGYDVEPCPLCLGSGFTRRYAVKAGMLLDLRSPAEREAERPYEYVEEELGRS